MANKWIVHIKKTMKTMKNKGTYKKGMGLKQVIMEAKKTWHKKGGAEKDEPAVLEAKEEEPTGLAEGGRRRRSHKRTRRHSRR